MELLRRRRRRDQGRQRQLSTALAQASPLQPFWDWVEKRLAYQGGFALINGSPGVGKIVALRLLADRLSRQPGTAGRGALLPLDEPQ